MIDPSGEVQLVPDQSTYIQFCVAGERVLRTEWRMSRRQRSQRSEQAPAPLSLHSQMLPSGMLALSDHLHPFDFLAIAIAPLS